MEIDKAGANTRQSPPINIARSLLLDQEHADNMRGFDNGILTVCGMCPPIRLMEYYQMDLKKHQPTS
jgi:hypothetical protein